MNTSHSLALFLALALLGNLFLAFTTRTARAADPVIVRVTTSGTTAWPCGDQSDWSNPCALQTALTNSVSGDELWVAAGTYTPTVGITRTATFTLRPGVALYGGFASGETLLSQRNFTTHVTILSGDIGASGDSSDNAYHVVTASSVTNTAVLDGFTVTGGNANDYAAPNNRGGGMYNYNSSSPTLTNVTFSGNSAHLGVGQGGGIANDSYSSPTLTNVTFNGNSARYGGGMDNYNSSNPTLTNVTFIGNFGSSQGGGMHNFYYSSPTLTNVTFSGNSSDYRGGGMYSVQNSNATLTNITFRGNSADWGGGMYNLDVSPTVRNAIFWGNTAPTGGSQVYNSTSTPTISDSVVQGGCPAGSTCSHIISADPRLGALGYYGGFTQTIPLLPGSSAIDSGDDAHCPATDQRGIPRPQGAHCDIGAFEAQLKLLNLPMIRR